MALPATDNFNRAGPALGANWTGSADDDLVISASTVVIGTSSGVNASMYWSADLPNEGQYAQATLSSFGAGQFKGPLVRASATDWVIGDANTTTDWRIEWYNAGAFTLIASWATSPATNDVVKITASGSAFELFVNSTSRASGSNGSAPATGYGGLYHYGTSGSIDNFEVGNLATATVEQEGFRFGVDDNNESTHGWEAAQDTNITTTDAVTKLIRFLANATGDPAAIAPKLKYSKNGGAYGTVPLVASIKTKPVIEAGDCTVSGSNTAAASWAVSHPAASTGDLLIFYIAWDDSTATTDVAEPSGVNGETLTEINATPITDASTETRAKAWYCKTTGSWTATTITFTPTATESWSATVVRVPAGEFDATTPIGTTATRAATGVADTNVLSAAMTAGSTDGGGALLWFAGVDTDPLGATNPTGWTILQRQDLGAVAHGVAVRDTEVTNSESIAGGDTWAIAGDSWTSIGVIVRAPTTTYDLYISTSANITAGGEATTARLTAPSGKATSDFVTGRRWDNENGTDTIDITTDDYTEVEWSLTLRSGLTGGDYFDFRVYNGDVALDTYTVTPRWTISTGISGVTSATQANNTPASTATLKLAAVTSQTQANNTSTATGTLALKGILTQTQASDSIVATGASANSGVSLITQADNTIASTAALKIQAVANQTQASNVIASTGALSLAANVTQSQADNTSTATGALSIKTVVTQAQADNTIIATGVGTSANSGVGLMTQADNAVASTAALSIKADTTQAQADNTLSSTAALGIKASATQTQADNTADTTGKLSIVANVTQSQADNVSIATGALYIYANTTATQDDNTITAAGVGTSSTNGIVAATQDNNTISASATLDIAANGLATQADNAPSITATLALFGAVGITADDNTTTATGALSIQGAVNVSQGDNVLVAYNVTPVPDRDVTPNLAYYKAVRAEQKRDLAMYMDRYYG